MCCSSLWTNRDKMWRIATVKLPKAFRTDKLVFPLILISIAALFAYAQQEITCNDLQCSDTGCNSTASPQYCTGCFGGFGLFIDTPNPTRCIECGNRCAACKIIGQVCPKCVTTYGPIFSGSSTGSCGPCVSVASNCTGGCDVNGAGHCDLCDNGFGLTKGNTSCELCVPNCLSCNTNITYCDSCAPSYFFYPNRTCGRCSDNCTQYRCRVNGAEKCDRCDNGYGLTSTNTCAPCAANCTTYGCHVTGAAKCDRCDLGFALTSTNTCLPCSPNCNVSIGCSSPNTCNGCNLGYGRLPNGSCDVCAPNCTTNGCAVNGAGKCDLCDLGFNLTMKNTCIPICSRNCNESAGCISPNTCLACNVGYGRLPNGTCDVCDQNCTTYGCPINGPSKCDRCDLGFALKPTNTCAPCSLNCNVSVGCDLPNTCKSCNFGYGRLPNGTCDVCAQNCTTHGCAVNGALKCDLCDTGFNLTSKNVCVPICSPHCNESLGCNSPNTCIGCNLGYGQNSNGSCEACSENCTKFGCAVNGAGKCDRCDLGFNLTSTNTCTPICAPNCNLSFGCNSPNTCIQCNFGYERDSSGACNVVTTTRPLTTNTGSTVTGIGSDGSVTSVSGTGTNPADGGLYSVSSTKAGWNNDFSSSNPGSSENGTSPSASDLGTIDWRVLLTLLVLTLGGVFVTFVAALVWATRFNAIAIDDAWSNRRRVERLKES